MASVIRPGQFDADTSYEPPLTIGFGIDSSTIEKPPAAMGKTVIPPGGKNQSHRHENSDAIHIFSGRLKFLFGEPGTERVEEIAQAGDFVHIPRREAHGVENMSDTEEVHLVFCYPGVPNKEAAGTVMLEDLPSQ